MQFCKARCVPLTLKPTDWESVFRSAQEEFCRPRCVRFWSAEQKATPDVAPIAPHGSQACCCVLRARGSSRQGVTLAPSEQEVQFTAPSPEGFAAANGQNDGDCAFLILQSEGNERVTQ
jgi:hypothetical protein